MAKTQTLTTKSPLLFSPENSIFEEDVQAVVEQQNWTFGHITHPHMSCHTGAFASAFETHAVAFPGSTGSFETYYSGRTWIDPDVDTVDLEAICTVATSGAARVRFTIGVAVTILTFAPGTTTETDTFATSSTGTGVQSVLVELESQTLTAHTLDLVRIENQAITATLPDCQNE